jgi:hypothetical protein
MNYCEEECIEHAPKTIREFNDFKFEKSNPNLVNGWDDQDDVKSKLKKSGRFGGH